MCLCTRSGARKSWSSAAGHRQHHAQSHGGGESKWRWAQSVAVVDCLQSILKPWTWTGPNHHNPYAVFRAGNMAGEEKQRRLCLVSSEKCWLIPWQFLGRFCTRFRPDTQLSKVLNVNWGCPLSLYFPLLSVAGDVNYWATLLWCKGCLFFGNDLFISLPFLFSFSCMLLQPKIFRWTSLIFKRRAYS